MKSMPALEKDDIGRIGVFDDGKSTYNTRLREGNSHPPVRGGFSKEAGQRLGVVEARLQLPVLWVDLRKRVLGKLPALRVLLEVQELRAPRGQLVGAPQRV